MTYDYRQPHAAKRDGAETWRPSEKLGVKYLDSMQIENTFPDYQALMQRIENQREMMMSAQDIQDINAEIWSWSSPPMYDNVYAIMGGRGTGKSSTLLTLSNYLKENQKTKDILFPIITPEIIGNKSCSILGWILATTELIIDRLEARIRRNGRYYGSSFTGDGKGSFNARCNANFFRNCVFQEQNHLRSLYEELCKISQDDMDVAHFTYEDAMELRAIRSREQYKLRQKLNEFWVLLTDAWFEVDAFYPEDPGAGPCPPSEKREKRPLIIMMFDDIDLVPERSMEILTTTFQYLSNINIVLILTAAEKVLKQVIHIKMFERMIGSNYHSLLQDFYPRLGQTEKYFSFFEKLQMDSPEKMMTEFYNKVIPPSNRYYLHRYSTISERTLYSYSSIEQSFVPSQKPVTSLGIEEFLTAQMARIYQALDRSGEHNFLMNQQNRFRRAYLIMFGDKNRNIANGCLEIMNVVTRLLYLRQKRRANPAEGKTDGAKSSQSELLHPFRHLLKALVLSKDEMSQYEAMVDTLIFAGNEETIYVNYAKVLELYQSEREQLMGAVQQNRAENETPRVLPESAGYRRKLAEAKQRCGTLMIMLFFIENILLLLDPDRKMVHGYRELTDLLNADLIQEQEIHGIDVKIFRSYQSVDDFLDESVFILEQINQYMAFSIFNFQHARDYLQNITGIQEGTSAQAEQFLMDCSESDSEWVKTILLMLFIQHSGVTLVTPDFLLDRLKARSSLTLQLFNFGGHLNEKIRKDVLNFLGQVNLADWSLKMLNEFDRICQGKNLIVKGKESISRLIGGRRLTEQEIINCMKHILEDTRLLEESPHSTAKRERYFETACQNDPDFMKKYTAIRWKAERSKDTHFDKHTTIAPEKQGDWTTGHYHRLTSFVEETIDNVANLLRGLGSWRLALKEEELAELIDGLDDLDDISMALSHQKSRLVNDLKACQAQDNRERPAAAGEPAGEPGASAEYCYVDVDGLVDYLIDLHTELFAKVPENGDIAFYMQARNSQTFFDVVRFLRLYETDTKGSRVHGIPLTSYIVLEVKMLEFLQPYYLAARFGFVMSSRYNSELAFLNMAPQHRDLSGADKKLRELYSGISSRSPETNHSNRGQLCALMRGVRGAFARRYYTYLEASQ